MSIVRHFGELGIPPGRDGYFVIRFSECDTMPRSVAPLMRQHNREIAGALGYAPAEIDALVRDGVLYAEEAVARLAAAR